MSTTGYERLSGEPQITSAVAPASDVWARTSVVGGRADLADEFSKQPLLTHIGHQTQKRWLRRTASPRRGKLR